MTEEPPIPTHKLYIAGPMRGYPDNNVSAFYKAEWHLRKCFLTVQDIFNPAKETVRRKLDKDDIRLLMKVDLNWICTTATHVILLDKWWESRGATTEEALARAIEIPSMPLEDYIEGYWNTYGDYHIKNDML